MASAVAFDAETLEVAAFADLNGAMTLVSVSARAQARESLGWAEALLGESAVRVVSASQGWPGSPVKRYYRVYRMFAWGTEPQALRAVLAGQRWVYSDRAGVAESRFRLLTGL